MFIGKTTGVVKFQFSCPLWDFALKYFSLTPFPHLKIGMIFALFIDYMKCNHLINIIPTAVLFL